MKLAQLSGNVVAFRKQKYKGVIVAPDGAEVNPWTVCEVVDFGDEVSIELSQGDKIIMPTASLGSSIPIKMQVKDFDTEEYGDEEDIYFQHKPEFFIKVEDESSPILI
jgi:hypothetical protein